MTRIQAPEVVEAFAVAGDVRTPYLTAGRGAVVVVLADTVGRLSALVAGLANAFRVVAPAPWDSTARVAPTTAGGDALPRPAGPRDFPGWIDSFLDALGVSSVFVVADAPLAADALGYALLARDRVRGLAVLQPGDVGRGSHGETASARLEAGAPIWTIGVADESSAAIARATRSIMSMVDEAQGITRD